MTQVPNRLRNSGRAVDDRRGAERARGRQGQREKVTRDREVERWRGGRDREGRGRSRNRTERQGETGGDSQRLGKTGRHRGREPGGIPVTGKRSGVFLLLTSPLRSGKVP